MQKRYALAIVAALLLFFLILIVLLAMRRGNGTRVSEATPSPIASIMVTPSTSEELTQTYTNDQFKFSFNYPADWVISEDTIEPIREVTLTSPNNFRLAASYGPSGVGGQCEADQNTAVAMDQVTLLGRTMYVHVTGNKAANTATSAYVLNSEKPCGNIPYMTIPAMLNQPEGLVKIEMYYGDRVQTGATDFMSPDYQTAKRILESATIRL